jgi:hypothetical protein
LIDECHRSAGRSSASHKRRWVERGLTKLRSGCVSPKEDLETALSSSSADRVPRDVEPTAREPSLRPGWNDGWKKDGRLSIGVR